MPGDDGRGGARLPPPSSVSLPDNNKYNSVTTSNQTRQHPAVTHSEVQSSQINRRPMIDNALLKIGRGDNPKHRKRHEIGRKPDIFNIEINLLDGTYSHIEHVSSFDSLIC